MLLSSNIPISHLVVDFINQAIPEAKHLYGIMRQENKAVHIYTEHGEYEEELPKGLEQFLNKANTGWYTFTETPFSQSTQIGQTSLEMELNRDYLFLKGIECGSGTLFILASFKPYGISKTKYLLAGEKKMMENSVRGIASSLIAQAQRDHTILKHIAQSNQQTKQEIGTIKQQLDYQSKNFEVAITQFIQLIIDRLQDQFGVPIRLSKAFIQALKTYNQPFESLEDNLKQHIQIELNLAMVQGESEITLTPAHLQALGKSVQRNKASTSETDLNLGRYAKTYKLLDRYERSAELVQQKGLKIIGKHIGSHCSPSVSNASITDALNKHAKKIFELFKRYPDRWPIIRTDFRSVANILEKEAIRRQQIA